MLSLRIPLPDTAMDFQAASRLARRVAGEHDMKDPTIVSWHQHSTHTLSPRFDGGNEEGWWEKFGTGNGGRLEVHIGDEFDFILMDSQGFETVDQLPIRNLEDCDGREYLCFTPLLNDRCIPSQTACTPLDEWAADQY